MKSLLDIKCPACNTKHDQFGNLELVREINIPPNMDNDGSPHSTIKKFYKAICPVSLSLVTIIIAKYLGSKESKRYYVFKGNRYDPDKIISNNSPTIKDKNIEVHATELAQGYIIAILKDHRGPENSISRPELLRQVNRSYGGNKNYMDDRTMRRAIQYLRSTEIGKWIFASQKKPYGYFLARNEDEAKKYIAPDFKRIQTIYFSRLAQMKLIGLEINPSMQIEMEL